ncbi:MAG: DUF3631 domain-containing protein [Thalassospira sp.]|nr:DUF3631 domain-containing protein [Thalassospira sp.]
MSIQEADTVIKQAVVDAALPAETFLGNAPAAPAAPKPTLEQRLNAEVLNLAALNKAAYALKRKGAAEAFEIPVGMLDDLVKEQRRQGDDDGLQGKGIELPEPAHWPDKVDGAALLLALSAFIRRYIYVSDEALTAISLWLLHTYNIECFRHSPFMAVQSPEKGCGKSTLLAVLFVLSYRALSASNISPAAVFRVIEAHQPTLVIDEIDTVFSREGNEDLRGILNAGHSKPMACVMRVVGDAHEVRQFSVWAAKAVAGIGTLPETLQSRAVVIRLERKLTTDKIERLRPEKLLPDISRLQSQAHRFMQDNAAQLTEYDVDIDDIGDRDVDNWRPLLAIADAAGGVWPQKALQALYTLTGAAKRYQQLTLPQQLLADVKAIFEDDPRSFIPTTDLIATLHKRDERPWRTYKHNGLTPESFAYLLREYGVKTKQVRLGQTPVRGLNRSDMVHIFTRYTGADTHSGGISDFQPVTPLQPNDSDGLSYTATCDTVTGQEALEATENKECNGVTGYKPENGSVRVPASVSTAWSITL